MIFFNTIDGRNPAPVDMISVPLFLILCHLGAFFAISTHNGTPECSPASLAVHSSGKAWKRKIVYTGWFYDDLMFPRDIFRFDTLAAKRCFLLQLNSVVLEEVQLIRAASTFKSIAGPARKWASTREQNPPRPRRNTGGFSLAGQI